MDNHDCCKELNNFTMNNNYNQLKKILIDKLILLSTNMDTFKNIFINNNNIGCTFNLLDSIINKNFKILQSINDNYFIYKNNTYFTQEIRNLRVNLNKINYIIHIIFVKFIINYLQYNNENVLNDIDMCNCDQEDNQDPDYKINIPDEENFNEITLDYKSEDIDKYLKLFILDSDFIIIDYIIDKNEVLRINDNNNISELFECTCNKIITFINRIKYEVEYLN